MNEYLSPGKFADSDHPELVNFVLDATKNTKDKQEAIVRLYHVVRDKWWYDPYRLDLTEEGLKASNLLNRDHGYCVEKSNFFVAGARVLGIPSRIGFANVRNHMGVERYVAITGTDILAYHGYAEVYLNDKWVKATPVFNEELCKKLGVAPLEFDGTGDSIFQAYNSKGDQFMEYLEDHGTFADIPREMMLEGIKKYYPKLSDMEFAKANGFEVTI
jgi:transglutaminase-like putative cysteine protease